MNRARGPGDPLDLPSDADPFIDFEMDRMMRRIMAKNEYFMMTGHRAPDNYPADPVYGPDPRPAMGQSLRAAMSAVTEADEDDW